MYLFSIERRVEQWCSLKGERRYTQRRKQQDRQLRPEEILKEWWQETKRKSGGGFLGQYQGIYEAGT